MKNIAVISTDWHIDTGNVELSKQLAAQQIQLAKDSGVKLLICLGDIFENKKGQPEIVLNCFEQILDMVQKAGMTLWAIAGNHDKTNPYSWESYLYPYKTHPGLVLIEDQAEMKIDGDITCVFQSYIKESLWVEKLQEYLASAKKGKKYLFSHQAMNGSRNNDGSKMESTINASLLSSFEKCFFGHYHDAQQPLPNAYHLAAWKQKNFGENDEKGFYVLYKNADGILDVEFHKSNFTQYVTIEVDAGQLNTEAISSIIEQNKQAENQSFRVSIKGSTSELKSIPVKKLEDAGIKVKMTDTVERQRVETGEKVQDYEKDESLLEAFRSFCLEKEFSYEEGLTYLTAILENGTV